MKKLLFLIILLISVSFSYSQEDVDTNKATLYNELMNAKISPVNQKEAIKLKDIKNKVIVVVFFAAWCSPCTQQVNNLMEIKTEFQKDDLFIIGLDADEEEKEDYDKFLGKKITKKPANSGSSSNSKEFLNFLRTTKINYPIGFVKEYLYTSVIKVSKKDAIPQTIVIQDGEIKEIFVGSGIQVKKIKDKLNEIFNKN